MRELRLFAPAALLWAGCLLLFGVHVQHPMPLERPLRAMPLQLAGYRGSEHTVSDAEQRVAGMTDYIYRVFARDSAIAFTVYVGYYQSQTTGQTIHSPRNCLPGAGWEALSSGVVALDAAGHSVTVNRYVLANGNSKALVYYWYQGRGRVAFSEYGVKWDLLRDAMRYGRTEEALVRIVVPMGPGSAAGAAADATPNADAIAVDVARELMPRVDELLPTWTRSGRRA